jgi:hypothetical protein
MLSSEMLHRLALLRTNISEEHSTTIINVTRISNLGTLAASSKQRTTRSITSQKTAFFKVTGVKT